MGWFKDDLEEEERHARLMEKDPHLAAMIGINKTLITIQQVLGAICLLLALIVGKLIVWG